MTGKLARRSFPGARLHVLIHAAPRTDYFDCREPVKRHSVDEFAGEFADVSHGSGRRRGAARDSESKSDDGKSSAHADKRSTARHIGRKNPTKDGRIRVRSHGLGTHLQQVLKPKLRRVCGRRHASNGNERAYKDGSNISG